MLYEHDFSTPNAKRLHSFVPQNIMESNMKNTTSLKICLRQMVDEKKIDSLVDALESMAKIRTNLPIDILESALPLLLHEGSLEQYDRFADAVKKITTPYQMAKVIFLPPKEILKILTTRGGDWLPRIRRLTLLHSEEAVWAEAISVDHERIEELRDMLFPEGVKALSHCEFCIIIYKIVGTENSLSRLKRWVPMVLERDFLNDTTNLRCFFRACTIDSSDEQVLEFLLQHASPEQIVDFILFACRTIVHAIHDERAKKNLLALMDMVSDDLLRLDESVRKSTTNAYIKECKELKRDPDADIMRYFGITHMLH